MNMHVRLGNPFLIFLYSLALLLLGVAVGMKWHANLCRAIDVALLAAVLMVIHDTCTALLWMWAAGKWAQALKDR
jgi:hypothetical protein